MRLGEAMSLRQKWAAAVLVVACSSVHAQDAVVITAARTPQRVADVVAEVTVLDTAAVERASSAGRSLVELLAQQPGLQVSNNGGLGRISSVFVRGLEARHTLLLVDGVPVGSATVGSPSLDNLPLAAIERIEIVRGPLSSLYGSGAMGGVVQVFLKRGASGTAATAALTAGSHGHAQIGGSAAWGAGAFDAAASVSHTRQHGISATNERAPFGSHNPDDDGYRQNAGSLRLGWQLVPGWRLEGLVLRATGRSDYDDGPGAAARNGLVNQVAALTLQGRVTPIWTTRLLLSSSLDEADTLATASAFTPLGATGTRQRQLSWEQRIDTPAGTVLALAERLEQRVSRPGAAYETSRRTIDALALGLAGTAGAHAWEASARHDDNSQFGGRDNASIAYAYAFAPAWRVGGSAGTSFVAPSFNQLYFPGFGNPLLQPEEGRHGEAYVRWDSAATTARLTAWRHRYRGFITSGQNPVNLPRATVRGATLAVDQRWDGGLLQASLDHTDPRNTTTGSANEHHLLPRRAERVLRVAADQRIGPWSFGTTLLASSHRYDDPANLVRMGGFATVDLRAERSISPGLTAALALNNVGDRRHETAYGYNQPGRELYATLRWSLR